jgi:hypothetical protein
MSTTTTINGIEIVFQDPGVTVRRCVALFDHLVDVRVIQEQPEAVSAAPAILQLPVHRGEVMVEAR